MATGNVIMIDEDGNIGSASVSENSEQISGLLFDISGQNKFWETGKGAELAGKLKDTVVELHSLQDAKDLGLEPFAGGESATELLMGIPYYHIKHFFDLTNNYDKTLYLMFADCSDDWEAIISMQKAANGQIGQFGVWTEKKVWKNVSDTAETYKVLIVDELQTIGNTLANVYNAPASIILNANTAQIDSASDDAADTVVFSKIPTCYVDARYVTVALGQEATNEVHQMQGGLTSKTPVGNVGMALGLLTRCNVAHSIGYVNACNLRNIISTEIEMGFGNAAITAGILSNPTPYDALSMYQLDVLDDKGYIFLHKYAGYAGVFFSKDYSCSNGDYNCISRNRVINKSRRMVRRALLPYVNAPIYLSSGGTLSTGDRTNFINIITDVLKAMETSGEISAVGAVEFDNTTNLLQTKTLLFSYKILPVGCAEMIKVTEGFTVTV